jgi:hypothetical protein
MRSSHAANHTLKYPIRGYSSLSIPLPKIRARAAFNSFWSMSEVQNFMSKPKDNDVAAAQRIMGALVRMPPKPHEEMKLGKRKAKVSKTATDRKKSEKSDRG